MKLPLVKGTKVSERAEWRDALPVNVTAFVQQVGESQGFVRTKDGLTIFSNGEGMDRGGIWSDRLKKHLRVSGESLIEIDSDGLTTVLAVGISGTAQVQFATSFNSVAFVANGEYYHWDGFTLTQVSKPVGAGNFRDITWADGYYILTDSESLWATDITDETIISPIDFAGSDFSPDDIVGVGRSTDGKVLAFNRYSIERFYNNAGPQFPFARIPTAAIPIGITGPRAKANIGDGKWIVFGGSKEYSPGFYLFQNSYQSISTKEIDAIIDEYSDFELSLVSIEFRDTRDQSLVICHLPRNCLVYDLTYSAAAGTPIWYEWKTGDQPWRAINGVYDPRNISQGPSSWIYGDKQDSSIGRLDTSVCTDYDEPLEWIITTPIVRVGGTIRMIELQSAAGYTIEANPKIFMSTTRDGSIYGPENLLSAGKQGEYDHRIIERRLGDYPNWFGAKLRGYSRNVVAFSEMDVI